jgi:hypothetical protein
MRESEREATASSKRKVSDSLLQGRMRRASKSMANTIKAAVFLLVLSGLPKSTSSIRMDALHNACPGSSTFAGPVPLRRFALRGGEGEEMSHQENGQPTNEGDGGKSPVRSRSGFTTPPTESRSPHPELLGSPRTQAKIARDVLSRDKKAIDELLQSLRKGIEESQTDSPEFASSVSPKLSIMSSSRAPRSCLASTFSCMHHTLSHRFLAQQMASASYAVVSPAVSQATPVDSSSLHTALEHVGVPLKHMHTRDVHGRMDGCTHRHLHTCSLSLSHTHTLTYTHIYVHTYIHANKQTKKKHKQTNKNILVQQPKC